MKHPRPVLTILLLLTMLSSKAQLCPGGGGNFNTSVSFDPAWIYGCNTGTSCNGGVAFDNRLACEPTTAMDACAPAPTCGSLPRNASDLWFKFFPGAATALISCFQNTSLILGIQAFRGGPACGSLTEIGCVLSGGPSSGAQLSLTGLTPGVLYYFRIFGSASPVSQRTGLFCFCGSTGLGNYSLLPTFILGFNGRTAGKSIKLNWSTTAGNNNQVLEIERSPDGISFEKLAAVPQEQTNGQADYQYEDAAPLAGTNYYRLKHIFSDGHFDYSSILSIKTELAEAFNIAGNCVNYVLQVVVKTQVTLMLSDICGHRLKTFTLFSGTHSIATGQLANGVYILQSTGGGKAVRFYVSK